MFRSGAMETPPTSWTRSGRTTSGRPRQPAPPTLPRRSKALRDIPQQHTLDRSSSSSTGIVPVEEVASRVISCKRTVGSSDEAHHHHQQHHQQQHQHQGAVQEPATQIIYQEVAPPIKACKLIVCCPQFPVGGGGTTSCGPEIVVGPTGPQGPAGEDSDGVALQELQKLYAASGLSGDVNGSLLYNQIISNTSATELCERIWVVKDQKSLGTNGGTFNSGSWETRQLNTISGSTGDADVTLDDFNDRLTLTSGTYMIQVHAPAVNVGAHRVRLQNITLGTTAIIGISSNATINNATSIATLSGVVVVDGPANETFEVQHQGSTTQINTGFGIANGFVDTVETYTVVTIRKICVIKGSTLQEDDPNDIL